MRDSFKEELDWIHARGEHPKVLFGFPLNVMFGI